MKLEPSLEWRQAQQRIKVGVFLAERTGLEPATSAVTGLRSNQLSYRSSTEETLPEFVVRVDRMIIASEPPAREFW